MNTDNIQNKSIRSLVTLSLLMVFPVVVFSKSIPMVYNKNLHLHKVVAETAVHDGRTALRVTESVAFKDNSPDKLVVLRDLEFKNGTIEVDVAGRPITGANVGVRGFIGVAFHVNDDVTEYECIYLRPTNGRADDQVRRNHSSQYVSFPEYPWRTLRESSPGKYEAYVDLVPAEWTQVRIEVSGTTARLFVHGAEQPTLIVNDLKLGEISGAIALRIGPGTEGWFSNLRVSLDK